MPIRKTEAVVLHAQDFQESDRIVTFFTREFGKLRGIARGAKKSKRRFGGNIEMFSHVELRFFERQNSDLVRIEVADFIHPFEHLRNDLKRIAYGSYFVELVSEMTAERQKNLPVFDLLIAFLGLLDQEGKPMVSYLRAFEIRLLSYLGYMPVLDHCCACVNPIAERGPLGFNSAKGGLICSSCLPLYRDSLPISLGTAKTLLILKKIDIKKINRISLSRRIDEESKGALISFIHYRTNRDIRSLKFIESLEREDGEKRSSSHDISSARMERN